MNPVQIRGGSDRAIIVAVTWLFTYLTTKGYISASQAADFAPLVLGIVAAVYGWWVNKNEKLAEQAASVPGTTVVTTPEIAKATPDSPNVISSANTSAVINKEVQINKDAEIKSSQG